LQPRNRVPVTRKELPRAISRITKELWHLLAICRKFSLLSRREPEENKLTVSNQTDWVTADAEKDARQAVTRNRCIYPNLKLRIFAIGMRQNRLAKQVGIDEAYLSRIINGVRVPGHQLRLRIATALRCDVEWLFEEAKVENINGMV